MKGKLVIFSAPSGAGKTTLVHAMLKEFSSLEFSVSACSRPKRSSETDGKDYYFLGIEGFKKRIAEGAFLEWEEVYKDHYYGTLRSEVDRIWARGHHVIFDVDVYGGLNIKKQFGERALAIFVKPPDIKTLEKRLRNRSTDDEESIKKRIEKALHEMDMAEEFDRIIINENLEEAIAEAVKTVSQFLEHHE
ncbi:MAG: guanylate kinase [Bacteroidales bacterium]|jgi:guanylate kinase|nr:guanylate kinase [Bacteroidales bacterium]